MFVLGGPEAHLLFKPYSLLISDFNFPPTHTPSDEPFTVPLLPGSGLKLSDSASTLHQRTCLLEKAEAECG